MEKGFSNRNLKDMMENGQIISEMVKEISWIKNSIYSIKVYLKMETLMDMGLKLLTMKLSIKVISRKVNLMVRAFLEISKKESTLVASQKGD